MTEQPIDFIASYVAKLWSTYSSPNFIVRFFHCIGVGRKVEAIYVLKYADGDWEGSHCIGNPIRIWTYRGNAFELVNSVVDLRPTHSVRTKTPVVRYCINEANNKMIRNVLFGYRAGHGSTYILQDGSWRSVGPMWKC